MGYFGAVYGPKDDWVLAHGYQGGLHVWRHEGTDWHQHLCPSGHFAVGKAVLANAALAGAVEAGCRKKMKGVKGGTKRQPTATG